jgi:hypothetical protein
MKLAKQAFEEYLKKIGQLDHIQLGEETVKPVTNDDNDFLKNILIKQIKSNHRIINLAVVLLCIIFIFDICIILYSLMQPEIVKLAVSGGFTISSLFLVINWLHRLWVEKNLMDVSLWISLDMQPEQAAKYIGAVYWRIANKGSEKIE